MGAKKISAPQSRDYAAEMEGSLRAQMRLQPQLIASERQYLPQWQELQAEKYRGQTKSMMDIYGEMTPAAAKLSQQQLDYMSPVMGNMAMTAQDIYRRSLGPQASGLLGTMQQQASSELGLGRSLSQQEQTYAQQSARAAMQARGLQGGNQAVAAEVLNNYNLGTQREAQRRAYAQGVYGLSEASAANAYNQYGNPLMQMIGATSPAALLNASGNMMQGLGPQLFNPESSYNASLITANRAEDMQAKMANQQASNAMTGAIIGAVGSVAGAGFGGYMKGVAMR